MSVLNLEDVLTSATDISTIGLNSNCTNQCVYEVILVLIISGFDLQRCFRFRLRLGRQKPFVGWIS